MLRPWSRYLSLPDHRTLSRSPKDAAPASTGTIAGTASGITGRMRIGGIITASAHTSVVIARIRTMAADTSTGTGHRRATTLPIGSTLNRRIADGATGGIDPLLS